MESPRHDHASDPHRRPLRHSYQEGPGFLFLATRGGRPARPRRAEDLAAPLTHPLRAHRQRGGHRIGPGRGCQPRQPPSLAPAPRGLWHRGTPIAATRTSPTAAPGLARTHRHPGAPADLLGQQAPGYPLDHNAVDHVLDEYGTARPGVHRERGPAYEWSRPDGLWHIDIKGPFFLQRARGEYTKIWIVGLVDDHSRFLIGLRVLLRPSTEPILAWLCDCFALVGMPLEVMSDNGSPFVTWIPGALTLFGRTLAELHIQHIRTQVDSPWTNGNIERFWGILQAELLDRELFPTIEAADEGLTRFAVYYDYHRLHGELGWQTPAERYEGSPFTDRGFEHVPALEHLQGWLTELMAA